MGDLNARTGNLTDIAGTDNDLLSRVSLDVTNLDICDPLCETYIPFCRESIDCIQNNYGVRLNELCTDLDLYILNGRFGTESNAPTCKNSSIVDYGIVSRNMYPSICDFVTGEFNPILSDVHSAILADIGIVSRPTNLT